MKNKLLKLSILSIILIAGSCSKYTEGLDTDPNSFSDSAPELIIGQAQLGWMYLAESNSARYAGIFTNQFTGSDRQYLTIEAYTLTSTEFDDMWDDAYVEGISQAQVTKEKATENGNPQLTGVAQITEAAMMGEVAALWGDVPYSEANSVDDYYTPNYDSQESVYAEVQSLLDQGITNVGTEDASLYSGNRLASGSTWGVIAHSLKARYYLHTKEYDLALEEAQAGISSVEGDLVVQHGTSADNRNLFYQFTVDNRVGYLTVNDSYLYRLLDSSDDVDRLLTTPGDDTRFAHYFNGIELNTSEGGRFAQSNSFPLISYYEVKLIEAEAAYRTGDEPTALAALNAVRAALAIEYDAEFPASTATGNDLLLQILEEKYITLIGELQTFHDVRRTKNAMGIPPKTGTEIPQRFLYPQTELDNNPNTPSPTPGLFEATPVNE